MLLYIDPGTGTMLFSIIMACVTAGMFVFKNIWIKIKFLLSGGKKQEVSEESHPYVIFSDHKRYWNVFEPVCDEFERREIPCLYWTMSEDDPALSKEYKYVKCEFIGSGNIAFAKMNVLRADICLATTPGLDVYQWKRSKNTRYYAHIYHSLGGAVGYRMFGMDYYDAILRPAEDSGGQIRTIEKLRGLPEKEIYVAGSTYIDALYKRHQNYKRKNNDKITVLLAPTWGASSIFNLYGEKFLKCLKDTGYKIIVRPHPQSLTSEKKLIDDLMDSFPENDDWSWNFDNDNYYVLEEADILISEFSGIICDFAYVFDKPVIFTEFKFDSAPYDAAWVDESTLWMQTTLHEFAREINERDFENLGNIIHDMVTDEKYKIMRDKASEKDWQYRGQAAKRVVDFMTLKYEEINNASIDIANE